VAYSGWLLGLVQGSWLNGRGGGTAGATALRRCQCYLYSIQVSLCARAGVAAVQFVNFRMHPAELGVVVLILAAWAGAVAAFLHKWRRLRIVPPRQLRYKHATPKNLDAVQVTNSPDLTHLWRRSAALNARKTGKRRRRM